MDTEEPVNWDNIELNIEIEPASTTEKESEDYFPASALIKSSHKDILTKEKEDQDNETLLCFLCKKNFPEKQKLIRHIKFTHSGDTTCHICNEAYTSMQVLLVHIDLIHTHNNLRLWKCLSLPCSSEDGVWSTTVPFIYIRHKVLYHSADDGNKESEGSDRRNEIESAERESLYVCHFCKSGFSFGENLYLHLVEKHCIEWDIAFNVAVNFAMLHPKKVQCCQKCPKTFSDKISSDEHTEAACRYFLEHYNMYTRCCTGCLKRKGGRENFREAGHSYCVTSGCQVHRAAFGNRPKAINIVYRHSRYLPEKGNYCCRYYGLSQFTCPQCYGEFSSFITLTGHYLRKHKDNYELIVSKLEPGNQDFIFSSVR